MGVAINYFIGWSMEELEAELATAQEDLAAGSALTRAGAGDTMSENIVNKSPEARIRMILKALNLLDSVKYPIDQVTAITETRVAFSRRRDPMMEDGTF